MDRAGLRHRGHAAARAVPVGGDAEHGAGLADLAAEAGTRLRSRGCVARAFMGIAVAEEEGGEFSGHANLGRA